MSKKRVEVYEALEKVSRARKDETKLKNLEKYRSGALLTLLLLNYHPGMKLVEFDPIAHLETENPPSSLHDEYGKLGTVTEGGGRMKGTNEECRQKYCEILSAIHKEDAENVVLAVEGKLSDKYRINLDLIKKAYPDLSWE